MGGDRSFSQDLVRCLSHVLQSIMHDRGVASVGWEKVNEDGLEESVVRHAWEEASHVEKHL